MTDEHEDVDVLIARRCLAAEEACRKALAAIAPCVVGWNDGTMPVWAENLAAVVPDLQAVLGIESPA